MRVFRLAGIGVPVCELAEMTVDGGEWVFERRAERGRVRGGVLS